MDPDVLHYMQILNRYKGLMVSVKLGSMDHDVLHYMQILNRYNIWTDRPIWYIENVRFHRRGLLVLSCENKCDGP